MVRWRWKVRDPWVWLSSFDLFLTPVLNVVGGRAQLSQLLGLYLPRQEYGGRVTNCVKLSRVVNSCCYVVFCRRTTNDMGRSVA